MQPQPAFYLYWSASRDGVKTHRCSQLCEVALASPARSPEAGPQASHLCVTCLRAFPRWAGRFIHGPPPGPRDWSEAACPPAGPITIPPFASRDWCSLGTCRAVPVPALIGSRGARDRQAQGPLRPRRAAVASPVARQSCDGDRCRSSGPGGRLSGSQG